VKLILKEDKSLYFVKTDFESPTLFFSYIPQYAHELQQKGKGVVFLGETFAWGLIGKPDTFDLSALEKACKEMSKKEVKVVKKNEVKFDFKEKGKKPVVTKDILQFSITGEGFQVEKLAELLK
jgi:hypothetical protein